MGAQPLYTLALTIAASGQSAPSDQLSVRFGVRSMTDVIDENGNRRYHVNGQPILLRGAGYGPELLLRSETDPHVLGQWMAYSRHIGLNVIRFEGKHPTDLFYDMADSIGMLMVPGWCCCDAWQHWSYWGPEQHAVAEESTRTQVKRLRIHASVLSFWYSSDELPPDAVEREYLDVFEAEQWPNTLLASASALTSNVTGPTGVKVSRRPHRVRSHCL
jgi:exo-1,4-beta-D-glucosaminidase